MQDDLPNNVIAKFERRQAHVAVIGLGYVGLPLAVSFAQAGYAVTGIDVDAAKAASINRGESYISDVASSELAPLVFAAQAATAGATRASRRWPRASLAAQKSAHGSLCATTDYSALAQCDAVSICVPTPLNKTGDPDMSYIAAAAGEVARYLHTGMVVVLESTTYPGTTTEIVLPILEENSAAATNGAGPLHVGEDFFLAFSPERVDPGRTDWTTRNTPKVLGGVTPACLAAACAYYGQAIETIVPVSSPERGRDGQAVREHLSLGQYCARQRAAADVRQARAGPVGGNQRGRDQALRLYEVHAGAGAGRSLHPHRPALSVVEAAHAAIQRPLHRACQRDQHRDAALLGADRCRMRSTTAARRSRAAACWCWA